MRSSSADIGGRSLPSASLPAPLTQCFDISESISFLSSFSQENEAICHYAGQGRILVGVNEPFNFPAPLHLSGSSHGQDSRLQIINSIRSSRTGSNALAVRLWAELENGSPLPEWLGFNEYEAEFWGIPERRGQGGDLRVRVYLQGEDGVKEVGRFVIEVIDR